MESSVREKLDRLTSLEVRFKYADPEGYARCYTCHAIQPFREMECGHFLSRQHLAIRFHEDNVRVQCTDCNQFNNGKNEVFEDELRDEIGDEAVDNLYHLSKHGTPPSDTEIEQMITEKTLFLRENNVL